MANFLEDLVEGETGPIDEVLEEAGVPIDLTGKVVTLVAYDCSKRLLQLGGTASLRPGVTGGVKFIPASADLKAINSPMYIRWHVAESDGSNLIVFPKGAPSQWIVRKP